MKQLIIMGLFFSLEQVMDKATENPDLKIKLQKNTSPNNKNNPGMLSPKRIAEFKNTGKHPGVEAPSSAPKGMQSKTKGDSGNSGYVSERL